ncbi:MAG: flagellar export chaperone FliS [Symbiobacteriaceae bacterium]|nr:flagellar export chaperone FliS [Symbiobacteriaceae bacterium]
MAGNNPYQNQYRQNQVLTATPQQLVLMLYDRALRDLRHSLETIEQKDYNETNKLLLHVEDILNELILSLDTDLPAADGGAIALDLGRLYDYYILRCREANIGKDTAIVDELIKQISDLRATWAEAMLKARQEEAAHKRESEDV